MKDTKWQWHTWDLKYIKADFSKNLWQPMLSIILKSTDHWQRNCISRPSSVKPPLTLMMFRKLQHVTTAQQLQIVGHQRGNSSLFSFNYTVWQVLNNCTIGALASSVPFKSWPSRPSRMTSLLSTSVEDRPIRNWVFTWTPTLSSITVSQL